MTNQHLDDPGINGDEFHPIIRSMIEIKKCLTEKRNEYVDCYYRPQKSLVILNTLLIYFIYLSFLKLFSLFF